MAKYTGVIAQLREEIKSKLGFSGSIDLPTTIAYARYEVGGRKGIKITLQETGIFGNMQSNGAAFEAWALLFHTGTDARYDVTLAVDNRLPRVEPSNKSTHSHYLRFLYRALKFDEQFEWFHLDHKPLSAEGESLASRVAEMEAYLFRNRGGYQFFNNVSSGEADSSDKLESRVEGYFGTEPGRRELTRLAGMEASAAIYRQLPVGLFQSEGFDGKQTKPRDKNRIFVGRKAAVDLWSIDADKLVIFELKASNPMMGIISELMFYANYMRDMYVMTNNSFHPNMEAADRGYERLLRSYQAKELRGVRAIMLADRLHPLITEACLKEMNRNAGCIRYETLIYHMPEELTR